MSFYLPLSLRKARLTAAGLLAAFAFSLLIAPRSGRSAGIAARQALDAALLFWAVLGVPVAALILGGSAGAEARADEALEAPLPLSARERAFTALLAAALLLAGLTGVIVTTAGALGTDWRAAAEILPSLEPMLVPYLWVVAVVSLYGLVVAFAAAFAIGSGATGGLIAGVLSALMHAFLFGAFIFHLIYPSRGSFAVLVVVCAAVSLAAALRFVWSAAGQTRARGAAWLAGLRQAGVVVAGVAAVFFATRVWLERFVRKLAPFDGIVAQASLSADGRLHFERLPPTGGTLLASMRGRVVWESGGKQIMLVPERPERGAEASLRAPAPGSLYKLRDGSVWLIRNSPHGGTELWGGPSLGPLRLQGVLKSGPPPEMVVDGPSGPELTALSDGKRLRAPLDLSTPLRWRPVPLSVRRVPKRAK